MSRLIKQGLVDARPVDAIRVPGRANYWYVLKEDCSVDAQVQPAMTATRSEQEHGLQMQPPARRDTQPESWGGDVTQLSQTHTIIGLVGAAKRIRAAADATDADDVKALAVQPVTAAEVWSEARKTPAMAPRSLRAVTKSMRTAAAAKRSTLVNYGGVRGHQWFDAPASDAERQIGSGFVQLQIAIAHAREAHLSALCASVIGHVGRALNGGGLPITVVRARLESLYHRSVAHADLLATRANATSLTKAQRREVEPLIAEYQRYAKVCVHHHEALAPGFTDFGVTCVERWAPWKKEDVLPNDVLRPTMRALSGMSDVTFRRVRRCYLTRANLDSEQIEQPTRPYGAQFERVDLACAVLGRWGSPRMAAFGRRARYALGELREEDSLVEVLSDEHQQGQHVVVTAALGVLGTTKARQAVVAHLHRLHGLPGKSGATETAVLALAPLPVGTLATSLEAGERAVLEQTARRSADASVRAVAFRVLSAWDRRPSVQALTHVC